MRIQGSSSGLHQTLDVNGVVQRISTLLDAANTPPPYDPKPTQTPTYAFLHRRLQPIMPRAIRGVLIECDPSIKSIIVSIDSTNHDYIIEDLDDERVVVKENMVSMLKAKLEDRLKENLPPEEESGSE